MTTALIIVCIVACVGIVLAIVGHLGTKQLAALAIAATVLSSAFTVFNFLTYGTTAQVARLHGAGRRSKLPSGGV